MNTIMPPSESLLVQGSGAKVEDMQLGQSLICTGDMRHQSHFLSPLVESIRASSQDKGQLLCR